jgi:cytochrome b involved in lipid metabolism
MKKFLYIVLFLALLAAGFYFFKRSGASDSTVTPSPSVTSEQGREYTLSEIAEHKDKTSCWLAIDGKVYDVTSFVASGFHPGKDAILQGCGKDATELFNTRPTGSGTSHSERARKMLPKYLIGDLAQ